MGRKNRAGKIPHKKRQWHPIGREFGEKCRSVCGDSPVWLCWKKKEARQNKAEGEKLQSVPCEKMVGLPIVRGPGVTVLYGNGFGGLWIRRLACRTQVVWTKFYNRFGVRWKNGCFLVAFPVWNVTDTRFGLIRKSVRKMAFFWKLFTYI